MTPGVKTSEFWLASISSVVIAMLAILVGYGVLTSAESDMWMALIMAMVPLALMGISYGYSKSRSEVKSEAAWADRAPGKIE